MNAVAPRRQRHLQLVPPSDGAAVEPTDDRDAVEPGDLVLLGFLLLIATFPLAGEALGLEFGGGTLGASALLAFLSGRELLTQLREHLRARP